MRKRSIPWTRLAALPLTLLLVVCGGAVDEDVKNDIAIAGRLNITATTLDGILTVRQQGRDSDV